MMMMSNRARKKDKSTPRMICSSLVKRPSATQETFKQTTGYTDNCGGSTKKVCFRKKKYKDNLQF